VVVSAGVLTEGWWGRCVMSLRGVVAAGLDCYSLRQRIQ
jgi:hypothetical protein